MADSYRPTIQWLRCRISIYSNSDVSLDYRRSLTITETTYALMCITAGQTRSELMD